MARDFSKTHVSIWGDRDFTALAPQQQHMYWLLMSQPKLSYCGVLDWIPGRLRKLAKGFTIDYLETQVAELIDARYVVLDEQTSELLVRTYIWHDEILKQSPLAQAMMKDFRTIVSDQIREVIVDELHRAWIREPKLKGWAGVKLQDAELFKIITDGAES